MIKDFNPTDFLVLAVDDNPVNRLLITKVLKTGGYNYDILADSHEVLSNLAKNSPDLILMDLMMPQIDGLELCVQIKSNPKFQKIPIIFLTASQDKEDLLQAFNLGAVDYVLKPFHHQELLARIKTHLDLKRTRDELEKALNEVEILATIDFMTNIPNRRYFVSLVEREFSLAIRKKRLFAVLMIDIDFFKKINDVYGHRIGDKAIKSVANEIMTMLRKEDLAARWGGEEFVVFLSDANQKDAMIVGERIREKIHQLCLEIEDKKIKMTVSVGVTTFHCQDQTFDDVLHRADLGLYEAKHNGRNKVVFKGL